MAHHIFSNVKLLAPNYLVFLKTRHDISKGKFSTQNTEIEQKPEEPDKLYRMIELEMRGHDPAVLKSYSYFLSTAARELDIEVGKCWTPKKATHERLTLLRSIHVHKKCRTQYEARTYFNFAQLHRLTGSTADTLLEYLQRNLPEGVAMKVTKVALEKIPDHIKPPTQEVPLPS